MEVPGRCGLVTLCRVYLTHNEGKLNSSAIKIHLSSNLLHDQIARQQIVLLYDNETALPAIVQKQALPLLRP